MSHRSADHHCSLSRSTPTHTHAHTHTHTHTSQLSDLDTVTSMSQGQLHLAFQLSVTFYTSMPVLCRTDRQTERHTDRQKDGWPSNTSWDKPQWLTVTCMTSRVPVVSRHTGGRVHVVQWGWQHHRDTGRVQDWTVVVDQSQTATCQSVASSSLWFVALITHTSLCSCVSFLC